MKIMTDQVYDENFTPMAIADLLDGKHHFVIPSFQRGYRWEEKQVTDLLEDIKQFANDDSGKNDSYFLQPVVVKACKRNGVDAYEVLDGQQRLTTMLLLLKRLMRRLGEDEREMYESMRKTCTTLDMTIVRSWISIIQTPLTTSTAIIWRKRSGSLTIGLSSKSRLSRI